MAEGLFNAVAPPGWRAGSAGTEPAAWVQPHAISVMKEIGIDITGQRPKSLPEALNPDVALVVGLCLEEACPVVPGTPSEHWPLADPVGRNLEFYRRLRDDLGRRVTDLVRRFQHG